MRRQTHPRQPGGLAPLSRREGSARAPRLFRFDVARGDEGTRFNAKIGYSF